MSMEETFSKHEATCWFIPTTCWFIPTTCWFIPTTCWFIPTSKSIGEAGKFVEVDETKFRRMKHHRGASRVETWVVGGVQRDTNDYFLIPGDALEVYALRGYSNRLSRDGFFQVPPFIQMDGGPIYNFLNVDIAMIG